MDRHIRRELTQYTYRHTVPTICTIRSEQTELQYMQVVVCIVTYRQTYNTDIQRQTGKQYRDTETDRHIIQIYIQRQTGKQYRDTETDRHTVKRYRDRQAYSTEIQRQTDI